MQYIVVTANSLRLAFNIDRIRPEALEHCSNGSQSSAMHRALKHGHGINTCKLFIVRIVYRAAPLMHIVDATIATSGGITLRFHSTITTFSEQFCTAHPNRRVECRSVANSPCLDLALRGLFQDTLPEIMSFNNAKGQSPLQVALELELAPALIRFIYESDLEAAKRKDVNGVAPIDDALPHAVGAMYLSVLMPQFGDHVSFNGKCNSRSVTRARSSN